MQTAMPELLKDVFARLGSAQRQSSGNGEAPARGDTPLANAFARVLRSMEKAAGETGAAAPAMPDAGSELETDLGSTRLVIRAEWTPDADERAADLKAIAGEKDSTAALSTAMAKAGQGGADPVSAGDAPEIEPVTLAMPSTAGNDDPQSRVPASLVRQPFATVLDVLAGYLSGAPRGEEAPVLGTDAAPPPANGKVKLDGVRLTGSDGTATEPQADLSAMAPEGGGASEPLAGAVVEPPAEPFGEKSADDEVRRGEVRIDAQAPAPASPAATTSAGQIAAAGADAARMVSVGLPSADVARNERSAMREEADRPDGARLATPQRNIEDPHRVPRTETAVAAPPRVERAVSETPEVLAGGAGDDEQPEPAGGKTQPKIEIISNSTFLPPVGARSTTIDHLAGKIVESLDQPTGPGSVPSGPLDAADAADNTVRVSRRMEIELNPRDLGTVRVNLVSRAGEVSIEIIATSPRAHELLTGQRDALAEAVRHAGATGGDVTVRIAADTPANRDFQSGQNGSQNQQQWSGSGNGGTDGSAGNRRQAPPGFGQPGHQSDGQRQAEGDANTPRRSGMYL